MIAEMSAWWVRQMRSLLPGRAAAAPDAMIVALESWGEDPLTATGAVLRRRGGGEAVAGRLDFSRPWPAGAVPPMTGLRLPAGMVLQRDVILPLAAERDLQAVLGFEMDRLTPFEANQVYWGIAGLRRDTARETLLFTLIFVLRQPVERLLEALASINLRPSFVESTAGRIELLVNRGRQSVTRHAWLTLCGVLALACLLIPVIKQQLALDNTAAKLAALAPARDEAMQLRQRLAVAASGQAAIAAAQASGDALHSLAALTAALPDGTWLTDLTLKSGDLVIDGESSNAAKLISVLAGTPGFHDPKFIAPVTRAMDGSADLFSIHVTVTP